ncbi:MAG: BRCT domain-containing protein [Clostridium sp.]|uniref:BRCT domain-containing protein n=1 Tax=Clostridium sp. TaxID=1506 RepID=UPI002FC86756
MRDYDSLEFKKFTTKAELHKALNSLEGIINGILFDKINSTEIAALKLWVNDYSNILSKKPYNELLEIITSALDDSILTPDEAEDILWVVNNIKNSKPYFDLITSDIQILQGIMHGIISDGKISDDEVISLKDWLNENDHLTGIYPYDELYSIILSIVDDGIITDAEKNLLKVFFSEFVDIDSLVAVDQDELAMIRDEFNIGGICAVCPEVNFEGKNFCFTGKSSKTDRKSLGEIISVLNGAMHNNILKNTDYLIVGNEGNPCWVFSCYGRKVEKAISLRKAGGNITIVHENDFWDAISDLAN